MMDSRRRVMRALLPAAVLAGGAVLGCQVTGEASAPGRPLGAPPPRSEAEVPTVVAGVSPGATGQRRPEAEGQPQPAVKEGQPSTGSRVEPGPGHAPDRLVVSLQPGVTVAQFLAQAEPEGVKVLRELDWGTSRTLTLRVADRSRLHLIRARLAALASVRNAELDYHAQPHAVPDDPLYGDQWAHRPVHANTEGAWDRLTGVDQSKVIVAIIDTGIDVTHEEFKVNVEGDRLVGGRNVTRVLSGNDGTWAGNLEDTVGHGTLTAGIIGATGNNGKGIAGVAWGCRLMPIKADSFLDEDRQAGATTFRLSDVINGMKYACDFPPNSNARVRVINMSLGQNIGRVLPIYNDAVSYARRKGILVVASIGNQGAPYVSPPANSPGVLAVGATASYMGMEVVAHFSNYGPRLDLVAPGAGIRVTLPTTSNSDAGSIGVNPGLRTYGFASGTSEAAPYVSGIAALVFAKYDPNNASVADPLQAMDMVDRVRAHLMASVDDMGPPGWDSSWGYGRINADKALTPVALQTLPPNEGRRPVL